MDWDQHQRLLLVEALSAKLLELLYGEDDYPSTTVRVLSTPYNGPLADPAVEAVLDMLNKAIGGDKR